MNDIIYNKDGIVLYHGDCLKILPQLTQGADVGITSAPYNIGENNVYNRGNAKFERYNTYSDCLSEEDYFELIDESTVYAMNVIRRHLFWNIQILHGNAKPVYRWIGANGFRIKETLVWDKGSAQPAVEPGVLNSQFEMVFVLSNISPEKRKFDECSFHGTESNLLRLNRGRNEHADQHKAVFPVTLPLKLIQTFTKPGETVLDYFAGTGTTLLAAKKTGRKAIGIELDEESCELAIETLEKGVQLEAEWKMK